MSSPGTQQETEFPRAIGMPATRALINEGITRFDQLATRSVREVLALHGVGPKAARILGEELASRGMAFAHK